MYILQIREYTIYRFNPHYVRVKGDSNDDDLFDKPFNDSENENITHGPSQMFR